jgi:RHS repeat-associated protein
MGALAPKNRTINRDAESQRLADTWKRGFTGHEHLEAFSLIHMNGRVYSTILSQFLSVDPVNQMAADTQSGNGYSYARNNPLKYTDPSGFKNFFEDPIGTATDWVNSAGRA